LWERPKIESATNSKIKKINSWLSAFVAILFT